MRCLKNYSLLQQGRDQRSTRQENSQKISPKKSNAGTDPEYFGVILLLIGAHEDVADSRFGFLRRRSGAIANHRGRWFFTGIAKAG
jgi:hypothetical protein